MSAEHNDNNNSILKIALNLAFACILSGIIIGLVYFFTADIAKQKQIELQNLALQSLVQGADKYTPIAGKPGCYTATKAGDLIAYIVPAESKGYAGAVKLLVAVSPDNKVLKYTIIESKETPGLGDKAAKSPFIDQFPGKNAGELTVDKDGGTIQAISGATITSRAVTKAVKLAVEEAATITKGGK
ncbi:MAG: RnfABCDGE type electron transport complex subunit G [Syntrophomonadaceae bacterium]|nr:RnfABCDGE type electron transport complex subunit G [Syntrophomonadaceae bacterium]